MASQPKVDERTVPQYLGVTKATSGRHPTDHPLRKPPLAPGEPRPLGNWVVILSLLPLPIWTYVLLRYNVFGGPSGDAFGLSFAGSPSKLLVDSFGEVVRRMYLRPGNFMVVAEAITAWMMASPLLLKRTNAQMTVRLALVGSTFHIVFATICCAVFSFRISRGWQSRMESGWPQYLSLILLAGSSFFGEMRMDSSRRIWKDDPRNEGKIYAKTGFNLCRHPNYTCFIIYRSLGIALAAGSFGAAASMTAFQTNYFAGTVVPEIEGYMEWKYGEVWRAYCDKVPYKLVPCVW